MSAYYEKINEELRLEEALRILRSETFEKLMNMAIQECFDQVDLYEMRERLTVTSIDLIGAIDESRIKFESNTDQSKLHELLAICIGASRSELKTNSGPA